MLYRLNALRALAAFAVLWHHLQEYLRFQNLNALPHIDGRWGVDLFFIISGFVIHYTSASKWLSNPAPAFVLKRLFRVLPLYWILSLLMIAAMVFVPTLFNTYSLNTEQVWQSLSLWPANPGPYLVVGWTLTYELFFYGCFAFLLWRFRNRQVVLALPILFIVLCLLWLLDPQEIGIKAFAMDGLLVEFSMGLISAELCLRSKKIPNLFLVLASLVFGYSFFDMATDDPHFRLWGYACTLWPLFHLLMQWDTHKSGSSGFFPRVSLRIAQSPLMIVLGESSYALYLSHMFALKAFLVFWPKIFGVHTNPIPMIDNFFAILFASVLSLFIGYLLWITVDRPSQKWFAHKIAKLTQP